MAVNVKADIEIRAELLAAGVKPDMTLDASGLACPMPLLKAKQALNKLNSQQCLQVISTDGGSVRDFKSWCELCGHELLYQYSNATQHFFVIRKQ